MSEAPAPARITVEVVYAEAQKQTLRVVEIRADATVQDAIDASTIFAAAPAAYRLASVGIFGRIVEMSTRLRDGDRIELYRPLIIDPKEARRLRAKR